MVMEILGELQSLPWVEFLRRSRWVYPLVNSGHIAGLALLFGAIVALDLRMLGCWRRSVKLDTLARVLLPVAIAGFIFAAVMGVLLFAVRAEKYVAMPVFQAKMALVALALVNALLLHRSSAWAAGQQKSLDLSPPLRLKLSAVLSIALWSTVIVCGRMIGYLGN